MLLRLMIEYRPNDKRAKVLQGLVADGVFESPGAALDDAVDNYLSGLRQRQPRGGFAIDPHPADNGAYRTQEQWIAFFNEQQRRMISAADVYRKGKSAPDEVLQSLKGDFDKSWLVSSTRNSYSGDDLSGIVTQNYGSGVVTPSRRNVSVIPVYNGTPLAQALETKEGLDYLQALFDTTDDRDAITGTLENLSGRSADNIFLWTPEQDYRKRYPERAVGFDGRGGRFHVDGSNHFALDFGLSRGVSVSPRSGRAKK